MSEVGELYVIIVGSIGWLLTLYFGFYRFKQYQWAKRKVQYDLFTRTNQGSYHLFLRATTLSGIKNKDAKIQAKRHGVLIKYVEHMSEKIFLMRGGMVPQEIGIFWINGMINELHVLAQQDDHFLSEIYSMVDQKVVADHSLKIFLEVVKTGGDGASATAASLYTKLTQP